MKEPTQGQQLFISSRIRRMIPCVTDETVPGRLYAAVIPACFAESIFWDCEYYLCIKRDEVKIVTAKSDEDIIVIEKRIS
jgi:hypothetical protein